MTAPERIFAAHISRSGVRIVCYADQRMGDIEYIRADLPPTLEQALAMPEINALVEAAEYILDGMGIDAPLYEIDPDDDFLDAANSEWVSDTLRMLATALRAIGEGGE